MGSSKKEKSAKNAEEERIRAEQDAAKAAQAANEKAKAEVLAGGEKAAGDITLAGQPKQEETERLARYKSKATTPGETLLQEAGPISQAVARRIQERVETPGLDYTRDLPAYAEGVTTPLWRALKSRGIAPQPGTEGGLGTQQFMKGAEPALAELRGRAVSEDIARGQGYGEEARAEQDWWTQIEASLADLIRGRQSEAETLAPQVRYGSVSEGAPYGVSGTTAYGAGMTEAARIKSESAQRAWEKKQEQLKDYGRYAAELASVLMGTNKPQYGGGKTANVASMGNVPVAPDNYYLSPQARQISKRQTGR